MGLHVNRETYRNHQSDVLNVPLYLWSRKEGNGLFNDALNTFYLRVYGVRHMVKDQPDSEWGNRLPPHRPYPFRLAARVLLYASSYRQDNTYHGLCYTSRGALTTELHLAPVLLETSSTYLRARQNKHHLRVFLPSGFVILKVFCVKTGNRFQHSRQVREVIPERWRLIRLGHLFRFQMKGHLKVSLHQIKSHWRP